MSAIVFSKRTGKYLKRHSGSFNHLVSMLSYKDGIGYRIEEKFGPCPSWRTDRDKFDEYIKNVRQFKEDMVFDAAPEDSRVYANKGSAIGSVGRRTTWIAPERRTSKSDKVYVLPEHLEVHEIKESFVCIMRPDGSSNCDDKDAK